MDESIESSPQSSYKSVYQKRMHRKHKLQKRSVSSPQSNENDKKLRQPALLDFYDNISEESCLDVPNDCDINKTFVIQKYIALEKKVSRYEDDIMSLADSRSVQTSTPNCDNLTASQKFASCHELLSESAELSANGSEFHITDTELIECCNKVEVMMKEENNIDAPERARGDNNNKTIVDMIFEDFSTTPFNSPIASPESKLRKLERTPLFILLEKPKRCYSRKFKEKAKSNLEEKFKAAIEDDHDNMSTCSSSLSSLSIQGDFTTIDEHDRSVLPNTSQHLCENLLQISNYFTQSSNSELYLRKEILTSKSKVDDTCKIPPNLVPVIEEILALRSKNIEYLVAELDICDGDFLGFPERLQCKNDEHLLNVCNQFDDTLIDERIVNLNSKKSYDSISETSDLNYDDIEKEDTYNVNQTLVSSNQCKTGISKNYHWDEDDNDLFACISTQEILDQNEKINNNFPSISKFPVNKQIPKGNQRYNISGCSKNLVLKEINIALGVQKDSGERAELREGKNAVGANEIFIENELEEVQNEMHQVEVGKVHNSASSLVSAGFQTANGKKISISEEGQKSVQNILREFQDNLQEGDYETELKDIKARISNKSIESKFTKTANSSVQIVNKTGFQAAAGKRLMFEKGKQTVKHSIQANEVFIENAIEGMENKVTFKMPQDEVGKVNNPTSSLVSAGFQTANGNKISISEEGQKSVQNILREFQDNLQETDYETELKDIKARISNKSIESKFRKTANSSVQIDNKTGFQAAAGKRLMFEKGKETVKHSIQANGVFIENAIEGMENKVTFKMPQDEVGNVNNPVSSLISAGFQTANGKKKPTLEEGQKSVQNVREFQGRLQEKDYETGLKDIKVRMESKFRNTAKSSAQVDKVDKTTGFQTANGKNVLITEKGKKLMQGLLNEFHQSESDVDIENNLLCLKNKIISKKQSMLSEKKTFNTSLTSRKEEEYYPRCSGKLLTHEKKSNIKVEDDGKCGEIENDYANIVLSGWVLTQDNSKQFPCLQTDDTPSLALDDESKQANLDTQNTWHHLNIGHSTLNAPTMIRKNRLLSLNQKKKEQAPSNQPEGLHTPKMARKHFLSLSKKPRKEIDSTPRDHSTFQRQESVYIPNNLRSSNELCETPNRNLLQNDTNTPELGEFLKNAVETSTPCINRKLALQEREKDPDTTSSIENRSTSLNKNSPISMATLPDSTCCNVTTNSINKLTPKERMDRLSIYGEAPPINLSPVLMVKRQMNWRPSGLRRTRSSSKK
uniref:Uncharacterized protein n=1 Tax=Glossina morsitans morsitans TaxID=37546 RepID=A0A1B0FMQ1_GLOMM